MPAIESGKEEQRVNGEDKEVRSLRGLVEQIEEAGEGREVTVESVLQSIGERSFAPLLLVVSVLLVTPLGAVPGAPTFGAVIIALIGLQLLLGRREVWLPQALLRRKIGRDKLMRAVRFVEPVARTVDKLVHPRLPRLAREPFSRIIGLACALIALAMPPLEVVPLANAATGATVALFALALTVRDGLLVLLALAASCGVAYLVVGALL